MLSASVRMAATSFSTPALFYAFTLGMLAMVNPCGFPLLLAYIELLCGWREGSPSGEKAVKAIQAGALATLGFLVIFAPLGIAVEAGWSAISDNVYTVARPLMAVVGAGMVALGVATLTDRGITLRLAKIGARLRECRRSGMFLFGASYALASVGCSLPLFISGVATVFVTKQVASGPEVFISYALGMGCMFAGVAVAVAVLGTAATRPLRSLSRFVPRLGGGLLVVAGTYLAWYWISAIVDPAASILPERFVATVQQSVSNFLQVYARTVGALLGVVIVSALIARAVAGGHKASRDEQDADPVPPETPSLTAEGGMR